MEARIKALEDKFDKMDSKLDTIIKDVSGLRTDLAYLKGKADNMPTSLQLLGVRDRCIHCRGVDEVSGPLAVSKAMQKPALLRERARDDLGPRKGSAGHDIGKSKVPDVERHFGPINRSVGTGSPSPRWA